VFFQGANVGLQANW